MPPRSAKPQASTAKPTPDIYVGLLFVSVTALAAGIIFLVLELGKYDWQLGM